jgi:hypothetical protein
MGPLLTVIEALPAPTNSYLMTNFSRSPTRKDEFDVGNNLIVDVDAAEDVALEEWTEWSFRGA